MSYEFMIGVCILEFIHMYNLLTYVYMLKGMLVCVSVYIYIYAHI